MADPLYELLAPYLEGQDGSKPSLATASPYLTRLTTLSLADLTTSEPATLASATQSSLRALQALSKKSHKSVIDASTHLSNLSSSLPPLYQSAGQLGDAIPELESASSVFADKYRRSVDSENDTLLRRRKALLLSQNADRISSILDLPTLLNSAVTTTQPSASGATTGTATATYGSALDLHAHIKRLSTVFPDSPLVSSIATQAGHEMRQLTTALISSLQAQGLKLAGAMRMIGYLRRVAPELDENMMRSQRAVASGTGTMKSYGLNPSNAASFGSTDGALGALFLVCRLSNLNTMLDALDPLKDLADQEREQRQSRKTNGESKDNSKPSKPDIKSNSGHQTERYLKRYIEIFREQSFAIVSMYRNIFPSALPVPSDTTPSDPPPSTSEEIPSIPSPLTTFVPHLVTLLFDTLRTYLPTVTDKAARDSLMTQILYCAGSLGRLGGDFSMHLALLEEDLREEAEGEEEGEWEWVEAMKKHRVQASRLELLASGAGGGAGLGRQAGGREKEVKSPPPAAG